MLPPKYIPHYSVSDYQQWEGDWELFDGVPISMTPSPDQEHQSVSGELYAQILTELKTGGCELCKVFYELDWIVSEDTVVRPDVIIVCHPADTKHIEQVPQFIAEILSNSTRNKDLGPKKDLYEAQGVRYYLTIEPATREYILRELRDGVYQDIDGSPAKLHLDDTCQINMDFNSLSA